MKVIDYVYKSVSDYPLLYLSKTYEISKFRVMHHVFLVSGNGMKWAHTENPQDAGYPVSPRFLRDESGDYNRVYDDPYGSQTVDNVRWADVVSQGMVKLKNQFNETDDDRLSKSSFEENNNVSKREPYPIYDRGWLFYDIECGKLKVSDIKPDWLEEMIKITEWARVFYSNKRKFNKSHYYGFVSEVKTFKSQIQSTKKSWPVILRDYKLENSNIKENDYKALSNSLSELRRMEYVNLTQKALNTLKVKS